MPFTSRTHHFGPLDSHSYIVPICNTVISLRREEKIQDLQHTTNAKPTTTHHQPAPPGWHRCPFLPGSIRSSTCFHPVPWIYGPWLCFEFCWEPTSCTICTVAYPWANSIWPGRFPLSLCLCVLELEGHFCSCRLLLVSHACLCLGGCQWPSL